MDEDDVPVPELITARAHEVSHRAEYISIFEWLLWAHLRCVIVHVVLGAFVLDICCLFGAGVRVHLRVPLVPGGNEISARSEK